MGANRLNSGSVSCFAVSSRRGGSTTLLTGSLYGGVCLSTKNGTNWTAVNSGLTNMIVLSVGIIGSNLYAGNGGGGLWRRSLSELTTEITNDKTHFSTRFTKNQNYPNPFNPATTIRYDLPQQSEVTLKMFDVLGREAAAFVDGEIMQAGSYSKVWDASRFVSGVYFYQLSAVPLTLRDLAVTKGRNGKAGTFTETKKLTLLR